MLDKPRCKLYIARCESYLLEKGTENIGGAFEQLLKVYPSFIDAYIEYWKYLKFRMTHKQMQGIKTDAIKDAQGNLIVEKMRLVAEQALYFSNCTQVPTSLFVEAKICYAK